MKNNIGTFDRILRVALAFAFFLMYYFGNVTGVFGILVVVIGVVFLATAIVKSCPVYTLIGFNSCPLRN